MKVLKSMLLGCVLLFAAQAKAGVILSAVPGYTDAMPGDTVTIDIVVSGLTVGAADSLGDFDLDILYDPAALSVSSYSLTGLLGDPGLGEAIDFSFGDLGGLIDLALVSLLFDFELNAMQPDSFVLASIDFMVDVLAVGDVTHVSFGGSTLGDAFGLPLDLMGTERATIGNRVQVNEPAMLALIALPLLVLVRRFRK